MQLQTMSTGSESHVEYDHKSTLKDAVPFACSESLQQ